MDCNRFRSTWSFFFFASALSSITANVSADNHGLRIVFFIPTTSVAALLIVEQNEFHVPSTSSSTGGNRRRENGVDLWRRFLERVSCVWCIPLDESIRWNPIKICLDENKCWYQTKNTVKFGKGFVFYEYCPHLWFSAQNQSMLTEKQVANKYLVR